MIRTRWLPAALLAMLGLAACDAAEGPVASRLPDGKASLTILLKDAPGDVLSAVVTISGVYLQGQDGRVWLTEEETTTDLLTLTNDVIALVEDVEIPAGRYPQLRFVITGGYLEVEAAGGGSTIYASSPDYAGLPDGAVVDGTLHMPSLAQSGLKVKLPDDEIVLDGEKILLVDFDVSRSFGRQAGQSGRWVMHPVIEATELGTTGRIALAVTLDDEVELPEVDGEEVTLADFEAELLREGGGDPVRLALEEDEDGVFRAVFRFLIPGMYALSLVPPDGVEIETAPEAPVEVELGAGERVDVELVVTGAEPESD